MSGIGSAGDPQGAKVKIYVNVTLSHAHTHTHTYILIFMLKEAKVILQELTTFTYMYIYTCLYLHVCSSELRRSSKS
jgi:hypothetical protein